MRGNLIVMFVTAVCFSFPFFPSYPANIDWFYYIITKIHPPFQNPGSAPEMRVPRVTKGDGGEDGGGKNARSCKSPELTI